MISEVYQRVVSLGNINHLKPTQETHFDSFLSKIPYLLEKKEKCYFILTNHTGQVKFVSVNTSPVYLFVVH